jgi:ABC-type Zn uptake system ZnuABC Zn-binding protein ZnuA
MSIYRALLAVGLVLSAGTPSLAATLDVVTTTTDLASIAREVGGENVAVESLQDGTRDPHFLQAKPSYIVKARRADLWIRIGMEIEIGYEPVILRSSRNRHIQVGAKGHLDASERVHRLDVPTTRVDRSMGDVHSQGNPHYWLDPLNGRIVAETIAEKLKALDPGHSERYDERSSAFKRKLDGAMFGEAAVNAIGGDDLWRLHREGRLDERLEDKGVAAGGWHAALKPHRGASVASHHRSWNYLLSRFGLVLAAELEPKPGIPPSSRHLAEVIETVRESDVKAIMVEPFYPTKAAEFVAGRTGAAVVVAANSTGGDGTATDYVAMLDSCVRKLAAALGGSGE